MTSYKASTPDMPAISQAMPLADFPPFRPRAHVARPLTDAEARELYLREYVREQRRAARAGAGRGFKRFVVGAAVAALCLPTVERLVLHLDTGAAPAALVQSS